MKSPVIDQNHFWPLHHRVLSPLEEGLEKRVRLILLEELPRCGRSLIKVDGLRRRSPPEDLTVPSSTKNIKLSPSLRR